MMYEIKIQQYVDSLMKVKVAKIEVVRNGTALFGEKAKKGLILLTTR